MKLDYQRGWTALLVILALGLLGTAAELFLLEHHESLIQLVPFVLIAFGLAVIPWHILTQSSTSRRALQVTMVAFIAAGVFGVALHYKGSVEFQKEIDPSIGGFALVAKAMRSKAPPVLAPAAMTWFGLLGLLSAHFSTNRRQRL